MQRGLHFGPLPLSPLDPAFVLLWIVGAACALGAAWQAKFHRLVALVLAGGAGIVVCLTFVWLSAPDLALTQLLVEIVTTVLLLLGLRWLPKRVPFKWTAAGARGALPRRARDAAIAIASGCGLGLVSYAVMTRPLPDHAVSRFFIEHAWPMGGGTNVVNVIIVDFRGFDTLGEIAVLGVVAVAVYSLLRRFRPAPETMEPLPQRVHQTRAAATDDIAVPAVIMRAMFPVTVLLSLYLLLRGHNLPGGGFVAGITLAVGVILQYMAGGTRWAEERLAIRPMRWLGTGLGVALATGAGAWLVGYPFLTSHVFHIELPCGRQSAPPQRVFLRPGRLLSGRRGDRAHADRARPPVDAGASPAGAEALMEIVVALGIAVLAGSGVWLLLRPRTFQVIIGLSLLSYAVNLFIFVMGWVRAGLPPVLTQAVSEGVAPDPARFADPLPQALVLTAIVIAFATTALLLVVLLAARGLTGTDHVDGRETD